MFLSFAFVTSLSLILTAQLSEPETPPEGWMRDVAPDVTTNNLENNRIFVPVDTDLSFYQSSVRTLENIADYLGAVPDRRKVFFWLSPGVPMDTVGALPKDRDGRPLMPDSRLTCLQGSVEVCHRDAHGVRATIERISRSTCRRCA